MTVKATSEAWPVFPDAQDTSAGRVAALCRLAPRGLSAGEGNQTRKGLGFRGQDWISQPGKEKDHGMDTVVASPTCTTLFSHCVTTAGGGYGGGRLTHSWGRPGSMAKPIRNSRPPCLGDSFKMADQRYFRPIRCKEGLGRGF